MRLPGGDKAIIERHKIVDYWRDYSPAGNVLYTLV